MSRRDKLACVHEPFGDAFYYGPERTGERFENDAEGREKSGFAETTYADVLRQIEEAGKDVCFSLSPDSLFPSKDIFAPHYEVVVFPIAISPAHPSTLFPPMQSPIVRYSPQPLAN